MSPTQPPPPGPSGGTGGLDRGGDPEDPTVDGELKGVANRIRSRVPGDSGRLADADVDLPYLATVAA